MVMEAVIAIVTLATQVESTNLSIFAFVILTGVDSMWANATCIMGKVKQILKFINKWL